MSPKWDDEVDDAEVETLLDDIHYNRVDESAWDVIKAHVSNKKKRKEHVEHSDDDINGGNVPGNPAKIKRKEKQHVTEAQVVSTTAIIVFVIN